MLVVDLQRRVLEPEPLPEHGLELEPLEVAIDVAADEHVGGEGESRR